MNSTLAQSSSVSKKKYRSRDGRNVFPLPADNPYVASMTYHVDVYDQAKEKTFAQTAIGNGRTGKGLMSGFSARRICAEVAQRAVNDSVKQIMEGPAEAEVLKTP